MLCCVNWTCTPLQQAFVSLSLLFLRFLLAFLLLAVINSVYHSTGFHWVGVPRCTYPFCRWTFNLFSGFCYSKLYCWEHSCTYVLVYVSTDFSWNRLKSRLASIWSFLLLTTQSPSIHIPSLWIPRSLAPAPVAVVHHRKPLLWSCASGVGDDPLRGILPILWIVPKQLWLFIPGPLCCGLACLPCC